MRPIVSYSDIATDVPQNTRGNKPSPSQQRKVRSQNQTADALARQPHTPSLNGSSPSSRKRKHNDRADWEWESRELTHEEKWDDSALIQAWDAAMEEYEMLNGPEKNWKSEPVVKSALWYNDPAAFDSTLDEQGEAEVESAVDGADDDSRPVDFNTFIPTHDPSLRENAAASVESHVQWQDLLPASNPAVSLTKDEIFQKAVQSWYLAGYWTAMYQSSQPPDHRKSSSKEPVHSLGVPNEDQEEEEEEEEMRNNDSIDMLPAERD